MVERGLSSSPLAPPAAAAAAARVCLLSSVRCSECRSVDCKDFCAFVSRERGAAAAAAERGVACLLSPPLLSRPRRRCSFPPLHSRQLLPTVEPSLASSAPLHAQSAHTGPPLSDHGGNTQIQIRSLSHDRATWSPLRPRPTFPCPHKNHTLADTTPRLTPGNLPPKPWSSKRRSRARSRSRAGCLPLLLVLVGLQRPRPRLLLLQRPRPALPRRSTRRTRPSSSTLRPCSARPPPCSG